MFSLNYSDLYFLNFYFLDFANLIFLLAYFASRGNSRYYYRDIVAYVV